MKAHLLPLKIKIWIHLHQYIVQKIETTEDKTQVEGAHMHTIQFESPKTKSSFRAPSLAQRSPTSFNVPKKSFQCTIACFRSQSLRKAKSQTHFQFSFNPSQHVHYVYHFSLINLTQFN